MMIRVVLLSFFGMCIFTSGVSAQGYEAPLYNPFDLYVPPKPVVLDFAQIAQIKASRNGFTDVLLNSTGSTKNNFQDRTLSLGRGVFESPMGKLLLTAYANDLWVSVTMIEKTIESVVLHNRNESR